jgi:hypothetical protein
MNGRAERRDRRDRRFIFGQTNGFGGWMEIDEFGSPIEVGRQGESWRRRRPIFFYDSSFRPKGVATLETARHFRAIYRFIWYHR